MVINPETTATHIVVIGEDDRTKVEDSPYFITPSRLIIGENDTVTFINLTGTSVSIEFDESYRSFPLDGTNPIEMNDGEEKARTMKANVNAIYRFDAYCGKARQIAHGTRPVFIGFKK